MDDFTSAKPVGRDDRKTMVVALLVALSGCALLLFPTRAFAQAESALAVVSQPQAEKVPLRTVQAKFKTASGDVDTVAEVLVQYEDGSMLLLSTDGQMWTVQGTEFTSVEERAGPMEVATSEEVYQNFKEELPPGFAVYKTRNYVLVYNTSEAYVKWVGQLFEGIHRGFANYWRSKGLKLEEPRFPLVAVVFSDQQSYLRYAQREIGDSAKAMIGYYNMKTNRMVTYDLTGVDGLVPDGSRVATSAVINQVLSQPKAERTVATIIHEAVHQLAYNHGIQTRLADNPYWLSEGMAMFFESPDPKSRTGWGGIGRVNYHNLNLFRRNLSGRTHQRFIDLLTDDTKFQKAETAAQFYPEGWALTYFLMKTKSREFTAYLEALADLQPLGESTPRERIDVFVEHFGELEEVDRDFLKYITRLR